MIWSFCLAKAGRLGCSIVVHEGMYIDPTGFHGIQIFNFPKDFSLEIVGMENVRIVNTREDSEGNLAAIGGVPWRSVNRKLVPFSNFAFRISRVHLRTA